ncbi:uncharacterized protein LOC126816176 [Patella vulgata]|uniref:uncharacterized protein LOC126816176 n=1 Tax=Patella vulgata TaxID=6465 RepID=UPI0024A8F87A|nr:uncharacterized protein LOC126816176 [Patella vulgata]
MTSHIRPLSACLERWNIGSNMEAVGLLPTPVPSTNSPEPTTQRSIVEQLLDKKLAEGDFWYVVVAEWLEHLKKYLGIASTRKYYQNKAASPPGPIHTRRDYAHTVDFLHEDAWRMLVSWYGLAEGHKPMKLVVFGYKRGAEIEHNLNSFKVMLSTSPAEDFHNVRFSKMERAGHIEWKVRELYRTPNSQQTRLWAKADVDSDWQPVLHRDRSMGKILGVDSDFTRPIVAMEVCSREGGWKSPPEGVEPTNELPFGPLYEHSIFDDVTTAWEIDIHDQIEQIGKNFIEKLHGSFSGFVHKSKEYVEEREGHLREREREMYERESVTDKLTGRLQDKERRLNEELETCETKTREFESRRLQLEKEFLEKVEKVEKNLEERTTELEKQKTQLEKEKNNFEEEMKKMSELHKIRDSRIKLDIGGHQFTTSLLSLTRDPASMLSAMFSGRHDIKKETDGSYFIDRDGTHFRYILNYLRDGGIKEGTLPNCENIWRELLTEAEYYQLNELAEYLNALLFCKTSPDGDTFV